ncbi:hypothetical protein GOP47_0025430 [Adiantum capillus-veneris]|uniref:Uncharacterized protein n=1 Tax=Adiantum capillus-veneris TaxID=13818 RepID=A0A9D4Z440_ADICA|nr:hypothetical protein GOP47_0025430 [Adiantum capillus-veneris]
MSRGSIALQKSIAALSCRTSALKGGSSSSPSSSLMLASLIRPASSRISRIILHSKKNGAIFHSMTICESSQIRRHLTSLRGAIVSLQALHAARAQALFVSRLSFGSQELVVLIQGQPLCALTVL